MSQMFGVARRNSIFLLELVNLARIRLLLCILNAMNSYVSWLSAIFDGWCV